VENAIEISYKALEENPGKRVYLLSQIIHNQEVNQDLLNKGIKFIMDTNGNQFVKWEELNGDDVVIIPAFGTTLELESKLKQLGINIETYNSTCPFVEKVWKRSEKLGGKKYTIIIHGKQEHEETRATFSHSKKYAAAVMVRDLSETKLLGEIIKGNVPKEKFYEVFKNRYSEGFDAEKDLQRVGVVNQTTMLASETMAIADFIKQVMISIYGKNDYKQHFADTRDTLCYATNDNQLATYLLLNQQADFAIVVGGYNSSNTSHIVELLNNKFPTYFINSDTEIISNKEIKHYSTIKKELITTTNYLPSKDITKIVITSGASCPDTLMDNVMLKLIDFFEKSRSINKIIDEYESINS